MNPLSALVAGFITSFHCAGMCGPISCSFISGRDGGGNKLAAALGSYHLARLFSYSLLGALAGSIGARLIDWLGAAPARIMPWAFILFFIILLLDTDRFFAKLPGLARLNRSVMTRAYATSGQWRGFALGLATPFLPCGPLYTFFWVAALSGSAWQGMQILALFGIASSVALVAAQFGWGFFSNRYSSGVLLNWRRGIALMAIVLLLGRSFMDVDLTSVVASDGICH